jgi:hypothetical protein
VVVKSRDEWLAALRESSRRCAQAISPALTPGCVEGRARLQALGLTVTDVTAVVHAVRAPAMRDGARLPAFHHDRVR